MTTTIPTGRTRVTQGIGYGLLTLICVTLQVGFVVWTPRDVTMPAALLGVFAIIAVAVGTIHFGSRLVSAIFD